MSPCDEADGPSSGDGEESGGIVALADAPGDVDVGAVGGEHAATTSVSSTATGPRKWPLRPIPPIR
jgi:hypothetical protein